jgi:hypothetical protein
MEHPAVKSKDHSFFLISDERHMHLNIDGSAFCSQKQFERTQDKSPHNQLQSHRPLTQEKTKRKQEGKCALLQLASKATDQIGLRALFIRRTGNVF